MATLDELAPLDLLWTTRLPPDGDSGGGGGLAVVHVEGREIMDVYQMYERVCGEGAGGRRRPHATTTRNAPP